MVKRGSYRTNTCTLTIEISWELAEFLADNSGEFLAELVALVRERREYQKQQSEEDARSEKRRQTRRLAYRLNAIFAAAELRRRTERPGANETRTDVLHELAERYSLQVSVLAHLIRVHQTAANKRARAKRDTRIYRMYLAGQRNNRIAAAAGVSIGTVSRVLNRRRRELALTSPRGQS